MLAFESLRREVHPYVPPHEVVFHIDRLRARLRDDGLHAVWTGPPGYGHRPPMFQVRGRRYSIFEFAYLAFFGAIPDGWRAVAGCENSLCLAHLVLAPRRSCGGR